VLGLDPDPARLWPRAVELADRAPGERSTAARAARAVAAHCSLAIEATAAYCVAVKLQVACFERLGGPGWAALREVAQRARARQLLVIADAKRGDIGSTSQAYAEAWLAPRDGGPPVADAMTVNPYMGGDSLEPFLLACGAGSGLFVLVRTSNPGAADLQEQRLADGRRVWERTAELVAGWGAELVGESGLSSVGAVIGATSPEAVERARELMPRQVLLLPGVGAQGGRAGDLAAAFRDHPAGGLVVAARSVIYAWRERRGDWQQSVRLAAAELRAATPVA
jgi:orotidine-5'-phosphate decarboxylase